MDEVGVLFTEGYDARVVIQVDPDPEKPYDDGSSPLIRWDYRTGKVKQVKCTSYRVPDSILDAARKWGFGTDTFRRYLTIFHGATAFDEYTTRDYEYLTFDTEDWRRAMGLTPELLAANPDVMRRIANLDEWRAFCEGDVYGYTVQRRATWTRAGDALDTMHTWEDVDSCGGFYGRTAVDEAAQEALTAEIARLATEPKAGHVLLVGSPVDGVTAYAVTGPDDPRIEEHFANETWWVIPVRPMPGSEGGNEPLSEDPDERYRQELEVIVDSFRYELCGDCHQDLSRHSIGPDPLGHPHVFCLDAEVETEASPTING